MSGSSRHLERIAGLLRQSEGTDNPHEAQAFLSRAQELATLHSIDLAVARATDTGPRHATPTMRQITLGEPGTRGLSTYARLFWAIAHANDVRIDIAQNSTWVVAYGMDTDIATVELFYARLLPQMIAESAAYLRSDEHRRPQGRRVAGITARLAFQRAFAARVGTRLADIRDTTHSQASATGTPQTSTSTELALRGKQVEVADYYATHSTARGTWRPARKRHRAATVASLAGNAAGARAHLTDQQSLPGPRARLHR